MYSEHYNNHRRFCDIEAPYRFDLIALFFLSFFPERALTVKRYCSFAQQHFTGS